MTDVDPQLRDAVVRMVRALESMQRRYCLIGALVPRFLMSVPPAQRTRDVDIEEDERRYGLEHAAELVPLEYGGAFLLGLDGLPYQDPRLREKLARLLDRFADIEVSDLGEAARDAGRLATDDVWRQACHQRIRWYRLGAQL